MTDVTIAVHDDVVTAVPNAVTIEPELAPIALLCDGEVRYIEENGLRFIYMESLRFLVRGVETQLDALLCLNWPNGTYPTRLFFPKNLGLGLNWHQDAYILARNWITWSWKDVPGNQPPVSILANHLKALQ